MEAALFAIHSSLNQEVHPLLPPSLRPLIQTFECDANAVFRNPTLSLISSRSHCVVFLPGEWVSDISLPPKELIVRGITGLIRFVFWKPNTAPKWSLPNTVVPTTANRDITQLLINNICRSPAWGLQTVMPAGSLLMTDRIYTRAQIDGRAQASLSMLSQKDSIFSPSAPRIDTGVRQLIMSAFGAGDNIPGTKRPTFQFGYSAGLAAHSLRWQGSPMTVQEWLNPPEGWKSVLDSNDTVLVQVSPETEETEVIVLNMPVPTPAGARPRPNVVEVLTVDRIAASGHLVDNTTEFRFSGFE